VPGSPARASPRAVIFDLWDTLTEPAAQRDRGRDPREVGEDWPGETAATLTAVADLALGAETMIPAFG
jgi:hypothetical protein